MLKIIGLDHSPFPPLCSALCRQIPRLYFTARGVPIPDEKEKSDIEDDVLGSGILVDQGGGVVTGGVDGESGRQLARRPVLMSRAMRDFAGLDQVTRTVPGGYSRSTKCVLFESCCLQSLQKSGRE